MCAFGMFNKPVENPFFFFFLRELSYEELENVTGLDNLLPGHIMNTCGVSSIPTPCATQQVDLI